ncbi:isochorismate synthase [Aquimarina hainanensis]|uniref:isochorismate synthase n=1 Tax=Aquimarina hainanensis TaxID=1578017 RepID=A0ABW5NCG6_9FLAO
MNLAEVYAKIGAQLDNELPFVIYRKKEENSCTAFLQQDATVYTTNSYSEAGFVFAPFDLESEQAIVMPYTKSEVITSATMPFSDVDRVENIADKVADCEKTAHITLVEKGIHEIQNSSLEKVVLSRTEKVTTQLDDALQLFHELTLLYSNAFVYFWYHPQVGQWVGATPETLLKVEQGILSTMALAGTKTAEDGTPVIWGDKEKEEQRIVTDFIVSGLSHITDNLKQSAVYTHQAGSLFHLRTDLECTIAEKTNLKDIITVLHPTPAVCGLPKEKAKSFIMANEGYKRTFYTGFLGPLHMGAAQKSELFVNLRCMEVFAAHVKLFVGGGITKDSVAVSEWEETVKKTETMKKVLRIVGT